MVPLKKVFPVIVVLITLSLLGVIYIQANWMYNASLVRREQIEEKTNSSFNTVREQLIARQGPPMRFKVNGTTIRPTDKGLAIYKYELANGFFNVNISDRFTTDEVQKLIYNSL